MTMESLTHILNEMTGRYDRRRKKDADASHPAYWDDERQEWIANPLFAAGFETQMELFRDSWRAANPRKGYE